MRLSAGILLAILSGCTPAAWMKAPGLPGELARTDDGTIVGIWRQTHRGGRREMSGYQLSIGHSLTFAAQKGCVVTGGVLEPIDGDRYRIHRYDSGYETTECGPWKAGPEVAPFDGEEVRLTRAGNELSAEGGGATVQLRRVAIRSTE